jgi:hypothetical protein
MGTPLGPTFSNYYMCEVESRVFDDLDNKPVLYFRYIGDCFLVINNIKQLHSLQQLFEENSVLKFTYEIEIEKKLPFLDVLVQRTDNKLNTSVYRKETNMGDCMNFKSLCPNRYKEAVIKTYLHRAYLVCNSWSSL